MGMWETVGLTQEDSEKDPAMTAAPESWETIGPS
jgi:hypothetical protein